MILKNIANSDSIDENGRFYSIYILLRSGTLHQDLKKNEVMLTSLVDWRD